MVAESSAVRVGAMHGPASRFGTRGRCMWIRTPRCFGLQNRKGGLLFRCPRPVTAGMECLSCCSCTTILRRPRPQQGQQARPGGGPPRLRVAQQARPGCSSSGSGWSVTSSRSLLLLAAASAGDAVAAARLGRAGSSPAAGALATVARHMPAPSLLHTCGVLSARQRLGCPRALLSANWLPAAGGWRACSTHRAAAAAATPQIAAARCCAAAAATRLADGGRAGGGRMPAAGAPVAPPLAAGGRTRKMRLAARLYACNLPVTLQADSPGGLCA